MMESPPTEPRDGRDLETVLVDQMEWAIRQLHDLVLELEAGPSDGTGESERKRVVSRLRDYLSQVAKERASVQEQRVKDAGGARDGVVLDFDLIRGEIGRRLDRIRRAGGAGDVS